MDMFLIVVFLLWLVQTIISFAILSQKNNQISNYKNWAESAQEELNRHKYEERK
tara:strand:- start:460 stop:621 length:162 start_codon:yes stop_codon:yes gene_type:complete